MSKTTIPPVTVAIAGDPPVTVLPATNRTTVPTIAVTIVGDNQTVNVEPAG